MGWDIVVQLAALLFAALVWWGARRDSREASQAAREAGREATNSARDAMERMSDLVSKSMLLKGVNPYYADPKTFGPSGLVRQDEAVASQAGDAELADEAAEIARIEEEYLNGAKGNG